MSGSTIGGAVGAVVGFYFGGPQGAQWGWMIGSAVGGYVDPAQIEGPRLQDARTQTSRDGIAIPFGWGTFPLAGNVIAQGAVVEHKKKERQGKGGPETTSYTYTRTYAIGLCEGPITGVLQVKRNGKVVYDARTDEDLAADIARELSGVELTGFMGSTFIQIAAAIRAANSRFDNKVTFYLGDETQMPDPALEAIFGAGKVPAHRGLAYFVVEDDDVTDMAGAIPQYEVVVAGAGTGTGVACIPPVNVFAATNGGLNTQVFTSDGATWGDSVDPGISSAGTSSLFAAGGLVFRLCNGTSRVTFDLAMTWLTISGLEAQTPSCCLYVEATDSWLIFYTAGGFASRGLDGISFAPFPVDERTYYGGAVLGDYVVVGSTNGAMIRSVDGGATFGTAFSDFGGTIGVTHVVATDGGFVASCGANVLTSVTGAPGTWSFVTTGLPGIIEGLAYGVVNGVSMVVAIDKTGQAARSTNGGAGWELGDVVPCALGGGGTQNLAYAGDRFILVGELRKVFNTVDGLAYSNVWNPGASPSISLDWVGVVLGVAPGLTPIPDAPGYYINANGELTSTCTGGEITLDKVPLSTIVANVCERRGIDATEYDVSQLTDLVTGFVVGRETDAASIIQSLAPAYFFDPGEWDGKLRFIKRGGTAVGSINGDDLVERDGDAFERERVQEAELLRRVTVGYNDPKAAYSLTTQKWERRAGTVQALGEASVELPLTLAADDAATIAKRRGLTAWGEPEKQKFSLPYRLSKYTPTDVLNFTDDDGQVYPIRLMDLQDDSGIRYVEASANSAEAYGATATGVVPRPPSITEPSLRGPTKLAVMDLPLWRNSDTDTLGLYVAGCGYLGGWQGAQVDVSTDGGTSYTEAAQITIPATIGVTTTALTAWASSEYPSVQSLTVTLPDAPESVSYEALLRYNNRAALQLADGSWEILQYQTVVANGNDSYTLSGLVRGRYATTPGAAASGATFVLLDAAVQFVPVERHLLGQAVKVRATTYGTSSDAAVASDFAFTAGASQTEWPVHGVTATRDVSDNVTVTWIGRARLGTETAPYHSTNFAGYRVSWDDGTTVTTVDTTATTYTITSAADPIDVTVTPLNSITGAGPASEAITV